MPKYNNNAGFKGYDNKDNSDKRTKVSPKMILVIGVGAFIVVFIVIILIISMSGNPDYDIKQSTTQTTTEESLNYDDVFGHDEDEDDTSESELDNLYVGTMSPVPQMTNSDSNKNSSKSSSPSSSSEKDEKNSNSSKSSKSTKSSSSNASSNNAQSHYNDGNNYSNNSNNNNSGNNVTYSSNISNKSSSQSHYEYKDKTVSVTSVSISRSSISLTVGESANLSASAYPGNATDKSITWSSTNNSIASVDNCRLNVTSTTLYKKQQSTIRLEGAKKCSWEISNPYVVTVVKESRNYIIVKAKKTGLTNVVATYNGKTYKCKVEVK